MKNGKKWSLSKRSCICFGILAFLAVCCVTVILILLLQAHDVISGAYVWVLAILIIAIALTCLGYYQFVLIPYRRTKRILLLFNSGHTIDEIFKMKDMLYSGMDETLQKFSGLLDKQKTFQASKKQAEYLALQNQINPHFLYNTLEAIRGDAQSAGVTRIAETTEALATFFRYTISNVESLVTLEDDLDNVENYFIIQKYRFGERLKMSIHYDAEDKKVFEYKLPKLTLQPIVENSIYHGLECKSGAGKIEIIIETTQSRLLIHVIDDGIGIKDEPLQKLNNSLEQADSRYYNGEKTGTGGIALVNVNSRIRLLFGEQYGLHIFSTAGLGTDVEITLPLITKMDRGAADEDRNTEA